MAKFIRISVLLIVDILIVNISYIASFLIRFDFDINSAAFDMWFATYADNIIPITAITIFAFYISLIVFLIVDKMAAKKFVAFIVRSLVE